MGRLLQHWSPRRSRAPVGGGALFRTPTWPVNTTSENPPNPTHHNSRLSELSTFTSHPIQSNFPNVSLGIQRHLNHRYPEQIFNQRMQVQADVPRNATGRQKYHIIYQNTRRRGETSLQDFSAFRLINEHVNSSVS